MDQSPITNHADQIKPAADVSATAGPDATRLAAPPAEAAPPLTPAAWLANNAVYLVILGVAVGLLWYRLGLEGVWSAAKVVFGIGFVIFIHELGHFLAAKWCDVHVQTFSIGFGPALPGCSFQRGETTYKLAVLPLGGYVNMVGEGLEADEDETYPRSFKNKTVSQRMLIISAGVVMNVLLGCVLFIAVYYYHGIMVSPAIVGRVDAGGVLWQKGIPSGTLITRLDSITDPTYMKLKRKVALSAEGEELSFTFKDYNDDGEVKEERTINLLPRKQSSDPNPVVGVLAPEQLRLPPKPEKDRGLLPVLKDSPAVAARPIPLERDEVVVAATDPENPDKVKKIANDLKAGTFDYWELSRRVLLLRDKKMVVHVLPKGADAKSKPVARETPLLGFQWNDAIIGCTEVQDPHSYDPFRIRELPRDPRHDRRDAGPTDRRDAGPTGGDKRDPFVFQKRLRQLAGKPIVIQVRRGDPNNPSYQDNSANGPLVNLFVPPAYHFTFGMRMKMGKAASIREDSPAARAGVKKGDELIKVVMIAENGKELYAAEDLDPERLPFELEQAAAKQPGKKNVILTLRRESVGGANNKDITCNPVDWDDSWDYDEEAPLGYASPLSIPQLGVAYWVLSQIVEVKPGSPAARAGLRKDDTLKELRGWELSRFTREPGWSSWVPLESEQNGNPVHDRWAYPFWRLQGSEYKKMQVKVKRPDGDVADPLELTAEEDRSWPLTSRGLILLPDFGHQKADSLGEALVMGGRETRDMIVLMYSQLRSLVTGRVSFKGMAGPIGMGMEGFATAQSGNFELLLFLGIISINLAVVNFLPIPILDGGHMVFLIYEKLRGRPPTEKTRVIASYVGLALIGCLMLFVFYQDIQHYVLRMFGS